MKDTWVLSIRTTLPEICKNRGDLKTSVYTFNSFDAGRAALRKTLERYAYSKNSMFDGEGNIIRFKKYIDEAYCLEDDANTESSLLTQSKLAYLYEKIKSIFKGDDTCLEPHKECDDGRIVCKYENDELNIFGIESGSCDGYYPILKTNMFSMEAPQHYYIYINDAFRKDFAASEFYIDLTRARCFDENSLFVDITEESVNASFAEDLKDMLQDLIDMGDDEGHSVEESIRSALNGKYETRELPDVGTVVDDIYTVVRCPICNNKMLGSTCNDKPLYNNCICSHCGWMNDNSIWNDISYVNGSTLQEYREAYEKLKNEKMYFITCFSNYHSDYRDNRRTFGYFSDPDTCTMALNENELDMNEAGYYTYAVVEEIEPGIHSRAREISWFCWDNDREGFYETERPKWAGCLCNFAIG